MIKVACTASLECSVGYHTCYAVLFKGKPIKSPATQRVLRWAKQEGFRITTPAKDAAKGGTSTAANIEDAERVVGGFDAK